MPPHSLLGPAGEIAFDAAVRRPVLPGGLWVAEVTARSGDWSVSATIRYRVHVAADVLVTRRALKRYQTLTDADVSLEKRELGALRGEPVRDVAELLGRWAARPVSAGAVVTADWLEPVPLVRRAQVITATVHLGGVSASTPVIALRDGRLGEVIPVRAQSGTSGQAHAPEFEARVVAPGRVEVLSP
jgi:flagella basal body P-ring formation protein FlgA